MAVANASTASPQSPNYIANLTAITGSPADRREADDERRPGRTHANEMP